MIQTDRIKVNISKPLSRCLSGHFYHDTLRIDLQFQGEHHGIKDAPKIPDKWIKTLDFRVFNWKKYRNSTPYCGADDRVSEGIYSLGVWEGFNTVLFLDILEHGDKNNYVLDFGANIGWYSRLAYEFGYKVIAFECDSDIIELFYENRISKIFKKSNVKIPELVIGWVDETCEPTDAFDNDEIEFLKCDIEGSEQYMYKLCQRAFENKRIKHAQIEISPVFNDSYFELVPKIINNGYTGYRIPQKGYEHYDEFENSPLEITKKYCKIETNDWTEYIKSFSQEDLLFIRNDLI